jgi:hypothetical protein
MNTGLLMTRIMILLVGIDFLVMVLMLLSTVTL